LGDARRAGHELRAREAGEPEAEPARGPRALASRERGLRAISEPREPALELLDLGLGRALLRREDARGPARSEERVLHVAERDDPRQRARRAHDALEALERAAAVFELAVLRVEEARSERAREARSAVRRRGASEAEQD